MDLLTFARGPGLKASILVFVTGVIWRLTSLALRRRAADPSAARPDTPSALAGAWRTIWQRNLPAPAFRKAAKVPYLVAYTFHLGLLVIVVLGTPHILFLESLLGFAWPGLPKGVIDVVSGITLGALFFVLWQRVTHPVRRRLSGFDDYITWTVTTAPVLTGLLLTSELGGRYEWLLAIHVLSFEVMLVWFPFGKLMHAFLAILSRGATGARFAHRGART